MRTEVPEFCGSMQPEEFLEWIGIVDEIWNSKEFLRMRGWHWWPRVTEAHQRALQLEKTLSRKSNSGQTLNFGGGMSSRNRASSSSENTGSRPVLSKCPRPAKRVLFIDPAEFNEEDAEIIEEPQSGAEEVSEELVDGDTGTMLMVRRTCLAPRTGEGEWLRNNIFQSTCTILGKVCRFVIDGGSCENIVSVEAVRKLGVTTEKHPKPYRLAWLQKGGEVTVSQRALISFSMGTNYKDQMWCDVVDMDACHLLLGRPWQYDRKVYHDGFKNTYSFVFHEKKIVLLPSKPSEKIKAHSDNTNCYHMQNSSWR
ncbi:hypothetical protein LWI28_016487 [Acer negundo]|uniref:Gag-pol polyprotein n=1 Tax=Acer negundo TaxID=4023 RepID=A0AAD5NJV4_ACENE|nr:hypothetical protein LWI28_016487 [Acer negundo]